MPKVSVYCEHCGGEKDSPRDHWECRVLAEKRKKHWFLWWLCRMYNKYYKPGMKANQN